MDIDSFFKLLSHYVFNNIIYCDSPITLQLSFQDPATPIMRGIIDFHNHLMLFIVFIVFFITYLLLYCFNKYGEKNNVKPADAFTHSTLLEVIWTIIPALILVVVAIPSFALLYSMDEMIDPSLTLKIIGHQWYWSYEFNNTYLDSITGEETAISLNFDSFMVPFEELLIGQSNARLNDNSTQFRNFEVDKKMFLPANTQIRLLVSSADVLHSWTIPSFGIKVDACPGRLNQAQLVLSRFGTFFGQCSEICGINHGFMPISCSVSSMGVFNEGH
jgi:cytochrome c oxidase subunit 2